jgi:nucleotide-binding universal stress UspA family protein
MRVLMVVDAAEQSHALLDYVRTAHENDAEFVLLAVSLSGRSAELQTAQKVLEEALHALSEEPGDRFRARLEIGEPGEVIARVAQEEDASVIMMPAHGDGEFPRLQELGGVAHAVAHRTNIPILIASPSGLEALLRDERVLTVPAR